MGSSCNKRLSIFTLCHLLNKNIYPLNREKKHEKVDENVLTIKVIADYEADKS